MQNTNNYEDKGMDGHNGVSKRLKRLVDALGETATKVHQLKDGEDSRKLLQSSFNQLIEQMRELEDICCDDETEVPIDLVQGLDSGRHPDLWFRNLLNGLESMQTEARSKAKALRGYHDTVAVELSIVRPPFVTTIPKSDDPDEDIVVD